jgi:hypothetical protein
MLFWVKTGAGWALNVDGSDAAERFTLPRLELRATTQGWCSVCMLPDGTWRQSAALPGGSLPAAKRDAAELAYWMCGTEYRAVLRDLLVT